MRGRRGCLVQCGDGYKFTLAAGPIYAGAELIIMAVSLVDANGTFHLFDLSGLHRQSVEVIDVLALGRKAVSFLEVVF